MIDQSTEGREFRAVDFRTSPALHGEYLDCSFVDCDFSGVDLSKSRFSDTVFSGCNFSLATLTETALTEVSFLNCKLMGLRFDTCRDFGFSARFKGCQLQYASFYGVDMRRCAFTDCQMTEVDFTGANLTAIPLVGCRLHGAVFGQTTLEKADLTASEGYSIDPERNKVRGALFSMPEVLGLLEKHDIRVN